MYDFDRISQLLHVAEKTLAYPNLQHIHQLAMKELTEKSQDIKKDLEGALGPKPGLMPGQPVEGPNSPSDTGQIAGVGEKIVDDRPYAADQGELLEPDPDDHTAPAAPKATEPTPIFPTDSGVTERRI